MKKHWFLFTFLLSFITTTIGIPLRVAAQNSQQGMERLSEIAKIFNCENFHVTFTVSVENQLPETKGEMTINNDKYRVEISANTIIYDGTTIYNYDKAQNELTLENGTKKSVLSNNPKDLFTIDTNKFRLVSAIDTLFENAGSTLLTITPKVTDNSVEIDRLSVMIKKGQKIPSQLIIYPKNNTPIKLAIQKVTINIESNPELFIFDETKYKNLEIIDFR